MEPETYLRDLLRAALPWIEAWHDDEKPKDKPDMELVRRMRAEAVVTPKRPS